MCRRRLSRDRAWCVDAEPSGRNGLLDCIGSDPSNAGQYDDDQIALGVPPDHAGMACQGAVMADAAASLVGSARPERRDRHRHVRRADADPPR
jgi:hypothetical protein